ncbi:sulfotransferase family 2 domain-containing protein [Rhizobium alvei]|uniref:Sulfotransferase family 2 domain-containing protein n=1 Tax=Rhizobium alvei TaxID=1132659 RepID=A0ABT8YQA9_9HYPH|nr:sulfotransferase family 2 domain-containing protein [Rhizobium alvei]MDO6965804.1 sulfotransferase family 2 domain-containing protein [Rhizobium alvei]
MARITENFVFVHVPKAGGTSITETLFELVDESQWYPREKLFGYPLFREVPPADEPNLYISHFGYNFFRGSGGNCMTVLRDPVERILSLYSYWKNPGGRMAPGDPIPPDMTLEQFIESDRPDIRMNIDNAQTWQLAFSLDVATRERLAGIYPVELLSIAQANVKSCVVAGVIERPWQFLLQLADFFGKQVPDFKLINANRSVERVSATEVDGATIEKIKTMTWIDQKLYDYTAALSQKRAANIEQINTLKSRTEELRRTMEPDYLAL